MSKICAWCGAVTMGNEEVCLACHNAYIKGHSDGRKDILEVANERYREYDLKIARLEGKIELLKEELFKEKRK